MSARAASGTVEVVLFDLGGVLLDLGGVGDLAALAGIDVETFARRWSACPWVRDYERGLCDTAAFAEGLVASWGLATDADGLLRVFAGWPRSLFPGVVETLRALRARVRTALLSNTNPLHWERPDLADGLAASVDACFLSFRTGLVKPDAAAFEDVLRRMDVRADAVLFLDDSPRNVRAARGLGLRAETAVGFDAARRALARHGLP